MNLALLYFYFARQVIVPLTGTLVISGQSASGDFVSVSAPTDSVTVSAPVDSVSVTGGKA